MIRETVVALVFYDDPHDPRAHELTLVRNGLMALRTYVSNALVCSVSSLAGDLFVEELRSVLENGDSNIVFNGYLGTGKEAN